MQGHPYRSVCDLRSGASTSLVELEFASHTPAEADESARVPPGLPFYSIQARMSELDVVFLNRFLMARPAYSSQSQLAQPTHHIQARMNSRIGDHRQAGCTWPSAPVKCVAQPEHAK